MFSVEIARTGLPDYRARFHDTDIGAFYMKSMLGDSVIPTTVDDSLPCSLTHSSY
jgi:hypothetical protein